MKELLKKSYKEKLIFNYYGELSEITPIKNDTQKITKAQEAILYFKKLKPKKLEDPIFNETDPAQEKANFRD